MNAEMKHFDEWEIERLINRAMPLLRSLSTVPPLREAMSMRGYDDETHQAGWQLLLALNGYTAPQPTRPAVLPQTEAVAELDAWDGPAIQMIRATCTRFPEQGVYLLGGIEAKRGYHAVANVQAILDRVEALRAGTDPARAAYRDRDRLCAQALADRNIITDQGVAHLRALVTAAIGIAPDYSQDTFDLWQQSRQEAAAKLKLWLDDWRGMARAIFSRREDRIRLGLAQRRQASAAEELDIEEGAEGEAATSTPTLAMAVKAPRD